MIYILGTKTQELTLNSNGFRSESTVNISVQSNIKNNGINRYNANSMINNPQNIPDIPDSPKEHNKSNTESKHITKGEHFDLAVGMDDQENDDIFGYHHEETMM